MKKATSSAPVTALTATGTVVAAKEAEAVGRDMKSEESIDEVSLPFYELELFSYLLACNSFIVLLILLNACICYTLSSDVVHFLFLSHLLLISSLFFSFHHLLIGRLKA